MPKIPDIHSLVVGQPYHPAVTSWPDGRADFNFYANGMELRLFMSRPTTQEIFDCRKGKSEFALVIDGPVIVLLYRLGAQPWSDATYTIHRVPDDLRLEIPEVWQTENTRSLLQIVLVDASVGTVKSIRAVTWSPEFSAQLMAAIRAQADSHYIGDDSYLAHINRIFAKYPKTDDMLGVAIARCRGGED